MARRTSPVLIQSPAAAAAAEEQRQRALEGLVPIPGDTFAVRGELKGIGAVWDAAEKVWKIAPDRLSVAVAIVENQTLAPATALKAASEAASRAPVDVDTLPDPFEEDGDAFRYVTLGKRDGATYDARETLRAVGARWDSEKKSWLIREDRADYARAILSAPNVPLDRVAASPRAEEQQGRPTAPPRREEKAAPSAKSEEQVTAAPAPIRPIVTPSPTGRQQRPATNDDTPPTPTRNPRTTKMAERIKLGGLWLNKTRDGKEYLSGNINGNVKILIFKNDFRSNDKQPTHVMYLAPVEQQDETPRPNAPTDSFFGMGALAAGGEEEGYEGGGEDFDEYEEAEAPPPTPAPRPATRAAATPPPAPAARAAAPQQRPGAPASRSGSPAPGPGQSRPAGNGAARRPTPPPPANNGEGGDDFDDFNDPFAE